MSQSADLVRLYDELVSKQGSEILHRATVLNELKQIPEVQAASAALEKLTPEQRMLVLLRSLSHQRSNLSHRLIDTELVVTFPGFQGVSARHTAQTVRQMIDHASGEIVIAGFAI